MTRKTPARTIRKSPQMPSVSIELGKYVTLRPRKDGTARVFFQVPERLRPAGWPSLTPLPFTGGRRGDLSDPAEVQRIRDDAAALYARLQAARGGAAVIREARDVPTISRLWQASQRFKGRKPRTQQGYAYHAGLIEDWSDLLGNPKVASIGQDRIEKLLTAYDDRPTTRRHIKIVLSMMMGHAKALGWIDKNPAEDIKVAAPKSKVTIWEAEDVAFYSWAAALSGQPALAALIRTQWEIGQRLTDVRLFRQGAEYDDASNAFRFWQAKTGEYVSIPVSEALRDMLRLVRKPDSLYLFVDEASGKPFAEQRLGHLFIALRKRTGGRKLTIRALRHSCVVQLARAGCTVPEIASITGHKIGTVEQILSTYLPRDNQVAWNAQAKRGIVTANAS